MNGIQKLKDKIIKKGSTGKRIRLYPPAKPMNKNKKINGKAFNQGHKFKLYIAEIKPNKHPKRIKINKMISSHTKNFKNVL